eukprot:m.47412 g.47412  ORF g.47412 m.47412 type:complete len:292 (+) comp8856_c0_seq1:253-1128(+)
MGWEVKASAGSLALLAALAGVLLPVDGEVTHWDAMLQGFVFTMALCLVTSALAPTVIQMVAPDGWKWMLENKPFHAPTLRKNACELIPSILTPIIIWNDVYSMTLLGWEDPAGSLGLRAPRSLWTGTGVVVAYMTHDCLLMLLYKQDVRKSFGDGMYIQLWGHHLLSICMWPIAIPTRNGNLLVAWFLLSEGSNVLLTARTFLIKLNHGSDSSMLPVSAGWLLSFVIFRIVPLPLLAYFLVTAEPWHLSRLERFFSYLTWPLPLVLNIYWFFLAVAMGSKMLAAKDEKKTG